VPRDAARPYPSGVLFATAILLGGLVDGFDRLSVTRVIFTIGWWLTFGDAEAPRTNAETVSRPHRLAGVIAMVVRGVGQFYVLFTRTR
jgi:hypothetical protein